MEVGDAVTFENGTYRPATEDEIARKRYTGRLIGVDDVSGKKLIAVPRYAVIEITEELWTN